MCDKTKAMHTPGPWEFVSAYKSDYIDGSGAIKGPDGKSVCAISTSTRKHVEKGEKIANARLIAAAPELLAVLEKIARGEGAFSPDLLTHAENVIENTADLAHAAIARAKGDE